MNEQQNDNVEKLVELVKDVRTCMLITNELNAENLSGRPMSINKIDDDGTMWFFSKATSLKVDELEQDKKVSIVISSESKNTYLMVHGTGVLNYDKSKMKELWDPTMKTWFPEGLEDPNMVLIKVIPHQADYWDGSASKIVVAFKMIKAMVTGNEYKDGESGTINL